MIHLVLEGPGEKSLSFDRVLDAMSIDRHAVAGSVAPDGGAAARTAASSRSIRSPRVASSRSSASSSGRRDPAASARHEARSNTA